MIHIFPLSFLKGRRSTLLQSTIINSRILVPLETDLLWNFDGVYRRWNAFCVNRWHSNRYYTINQGTAKRRNTNLRLLTWTTGMLVYLETDLLWNFDGVYRRWNAFFVNRWAFRDVVGEEELLPEPTKKLLFSTFDPIYDFHCAFLSELEQRMAVW